MTTTIPLEIDDRTANRLRALTDARGGSLPDLLREALAQFLDRQDGLAEDAARWQEHETGGIDNDIGAERLDRLSARQHALSDAMAGAFDDTPHPDEDNAREAARRAFRALQDQA